MIGIWKAVPAIVGALVVLAWSAIGLAMVESSHYAAAANLGYPGQTVRVIAVPAEDDAGPERLTEALRGFAGDHGVSIAYSASYATGLVTLLDDHERFRTGAGPLAAHLESADTSGTAAMSTALGGPTSAAAQLHLPEGVVLTGSFAPEVMFEDRYPVLLFSADALPFAEGVYLFAGEDVASDAGFVPELGAFLDAHGMGVADVMSQDASLRATVMGSLAHPYGLVVVVFAGIVALAQLVVLLVHAALFHDRWAVLAVLGAARRQLRSIVARRLLLLTLAGVATGGVLSLIVASGVDGVALAARGTRLLVVPISVAVSVVVATGLCWFVAWREVRKVARAVPS